MPLLAQAPFPSPPLITHYLLESPLPLAGVLILLAVILFYIFNMQAKVKKAILLASICLALSIGVLILAAAIETDRERIIAETTPLVRHTANADTSRLSSLLDDHVQLTNDQNLAAGELPHGVGWNKEQILAQVADFFTRTMRLKAGQTAILSTQGIIDAPGRGRTQVRLRVVTELYEVPWITTWRIDWKQNDKDQWLVTGIQPIDLGLPGRTR